MAQINQPPKYDSANSAFKVIVGMSGGVDSSVAAWWLKASGFEVEGLFMKNWEEDDGTEYCTAIADLADAQQVCDQLGIPLHQANFAAEYWDDVFEHFLSEYRAGRTPNPDILCNSEIKFKVFIEYARALGADFIATGHYAKSSTLASKKEQQTTPPLLIKAKDQAKDQTYFLHAIDEQAVAQTLFPLGDIQKAQVREIANEQGFITHNKKDSTGICFIGERRFKDFLSTYVPAQPGEIRGLHGEKLGEHDGAMYYTYGQRQGLRIGGVKNTDEAPWYVAGKNIEANELIVVQGHDHPALLSSTLSCSSMHFINRQTENKLPSFRAQGKTRYRQPDQLCSVTQQDGYWQVEFDTPQRAVTPGQYVVLYQGDVCLGGAVIDSFSCAA